MRTQTELIIELAEMKETIIRQTLQAYYDLEDAKKQYETHLLDNNHNEYNVTMRIRQSAFCQLYTLIEKLNLEDRYQDFKKSYNPKYEKCL